jgi:hypothetical protein
MDKFLFSGGRSNSVGSAAHLNSGITSGMLSGIQSAGGSRAASSARDSSKRSAEQLQKTALLKLEPASFVRQLRVLSWKSMLVIRRNITQFIFEIVLSFLFVFMLIVVRNFVERIYYEEQATSAYNVVDFFYKYIGQDTIVFFPDTPLVKNIVYRALKFLKSQKYWLNINCKLNL